MLGIGKVVEWSITAVLKTAVLRGTGGSNPSLSAEKRAAKVARFFCCSNFTRLLLDLKEEARDNPSWRNRANAILRSVHHFLNLSAEVSPRHANEKIVSMLMATLLL